MLLTNETSRCPSLQRELFRIFFFQRDETLKFSRTKTTQVKSQEYFRDSWLTMSKHWSFPRQMRCDVSDPTGLFEVRGEMCSEQECRIRELIYRAFHICASYCRSPPSLSCGFMRLVHVWVCVGLTSPSWLDSRISPVSFFLSVFSLSPSFSVAGPDRPLSSRMTTRTPGSSTTPTGNNAICIRQQLLTASTHSVANSNLPSCSTFRFPPPSRHATLGPYERQR